MKSLKNKIIHFIVFGSIYMDIEVLARAIGNQMVGYKGIKQLSLMGYTSLWMFLVGGLCGVIIGCLNDRPRYCNLKMWQQVLIGGTLITSMELISGAFFNLYLNLHLWDYSQDKFNFMGQIELKNCIWWYILPVIIIWFDDVLSCYFYGNDRPPSILVYFKNLITFK